MSEGGNGYPTSEVVKRELVGVYIYMDVPLEVRINGL